jgi:hypothetical protein
MLWIDVYHSDANLECVVSRLRMGMCRAELLSALSQNMVQNNQSSSLPLGKTRLRIAWSPCLRHAVAACLTFTFNQFSSLCNVVTVFKICQLVHCKVNSIAVMPPKKRRRTDTPQTSPPPEPTTPDLDSWPGWCEIESEPVCHHLTPDRVRTTYMF